MYYEPANAQSDFLKYINIEDYDYKNVLVLGVGAKSEKAIDLSNKYDFDMVIPISREGGPVIEDWARSAFEKLGIPTGSLKQLRGKRVENLFIHSWGSSRTINLISMGNTEVKNLHAIGSPHSALSSGLGESLDRGLINKVYFHINEGDSVATLRNFPSNFYTQGKFTDKIDFHFYRTEKNSSPTGHKQHANIPIVNVSFGYDKFYHYNSPKTGHGLEAYFDNMQSVLDRDPNKSPFVGSSPPFYRAPSTKMHPQMHQPEVKTMNEPGLIENLTVDNHILTYKDAAVNLHATASLLQKSLTHMDRKDAKMIVGNAKALRKFTSALQKDIDMAGKGGFALVKSYSLEQIGRHGLQKMPEVIRHLKETNKISKSFNVPDMSWAGDLFSAIGKDIETTSQSKFVLLKSNTLEEIGKIGLDKMPDVIDRLKKAGKLSESFNVPDMSWAGDLFSAIGKDIESTGSSRFVLLKSNTLEQVGKIGIKKMPDVVSALQKSRKLPSSFKVPVTFGAEDFAIAAGRHIGSGRADIDTITHYLDGVNQAAWGVVGYMVGGAQGAKLYQSTADSAAKLAREATQPVFTKMVVAAHGQGEKIVKDWQTLQAARIHHGLSVQPISEVYGDKLLLQNGFSRKMIKQLDADVHSMNQTFVNMKSDVDIKKIDTYSKAGKVDLGGVCICPELRYKGKGGAEVKKEVIESRKSENDLSWDIELPHEVE